MSDEGDWGDDTEVSNLADSFATINGGGDNDNGSSRGSRGGRGGGGSRGGRGGQNRGNDDGGGGGGDRNCFKCQKPGHMSRECPEAGGGRGGGDRNCFKCQKPGHMSRECPEAGGGGGGGDRNCYKCQQPGHMSRDCPEAGGGGGGGDRNCYKCQQPGHMSRDCPEAGGGGGGGDRNCFKCKQPGHMSRECPEGGGDERPRKDGEADGEPERPPIYVPEAELEGDAAFTDRKTYYEGSGINFGNYNDIKFEITGTTKWDSINAFADLKLRELVMENIAKVGYVTPTPIQKHASVQLMAGLDVMACAQTGSGKTAAFLLPIINTLLCNQNDLDTDTRPVKPEALILAPTRELAIQINREARLYSQGSCLRSTVVYGGAAIFAQRNQLQGGCNILVATPGRLKQFVTEGIVCMSKIQFFVLDEADRMLDMGFMTDVKTVVQKMPPPSDRVSGMFSATFPIGVQKAAMEFLKTNYVFVTIGMVGGACTDVHQEFEMVERSEKRGKLLDLLKSYPKDDKVLVFCNSKKGADFLAASLTSNGISVTSIHGDRLQSQRELALREFTQGKKTVLVATAVAARGLDIPKVALVVNYDLPTEIDEYVHRIGRTGRLGHSGKAMSFYEESQDSALAPMLVGILKEAGQLVPDFLEGVSDSGYGGGHGNGFSSVDARGKAVSAGAPKPVENDNEEDWD